MLRNMVTSLFDKERIETTTAKAKEARRLAERMITFARRGDLAARRHVARTVQDPAVLQKLFGEIAPRYADRPGGYTRVLRVGNRRGDGADSALLELVGKDDEGRKKKKPRKKYYKVDIPAAPQAGAKPGKAEAGKAAPEEAETEAGTEAAETEAAEAGKPSAGKSAEAGEAKAEKAEPEETGQEKAKEVKENDKDKEPKKEEDK
jgi:large subunit ribosomal protein L17